ncbi:vacuolar fusion protein CCZ1 homolog, partial [Clonorchis sinensis]
MVCISWPSIYHNFLSQSVMLPPKAKPAQDHAYYIDGDCHVNDQVLSTVLSTACETFELFNGKISSLLDTEGLDVLKQRLDHFFSRYLRTMLFEHCDLLDCFNGIQFTATDPADFARVQGLVNRIRYAFHSIRHVSFFYDGRLVQSTLELSYARHLYHYLNSFLFVEQPDLTHTAATVKTKHLGRFLVGPKTLSDTAESVQCPVLCSPGSNLPDCQLVTYQALRAVLCLVVRGINPIPMDFFVRFDAMVGPRLTILADKLACHQSSSLVGGSVFPLQLTEDSVFTSAVTLSALGDSSTPDDGPSLATEDFCEQDLSSVPKLGRSRFIYWNASTYAIMTTLHVYTGSGRRQVNGAKPLLDLMVNLRNELLL